MHKHLQILGVIFQRPIIHKQVYTTRRNSLERDRKRAMQLRISCRSSQLQHVPFSTASLSLFQNPNERKRPSPKHNFKKGGDKYYNVRQIFTNEQVYSINLKISFPCIEGNYKCLLIKFLLPLYMFTIINRKAVDRRSRYVLMLTHE